MAPAQAKHGLGTDRATFVPVKTILPKRPLPPNAARMPIETERLILRPPTIDDLPAFYEMRTQPEVMRNTKAGVVDADQETTRARLAPFLPPRDIDAYTWAVCLRGTGQMVGVAGCHNFDGDVGWPALGYMFRQEAWGKGYATEFVRAFLELWAALPRGETIHLVSPGAIEGTEMEPEVISAITTSANFASHNILRKCGFEHHGTWREEDSQKLLDGNPPQMVDLFYWRYLPSKQ